MKDISEDWSNHEFPVPARHLTPEQILTWLEGWREFMFEVWAKNPSLRENYLKLQRSNDLEILTVRKGDDS